MRLNLVDATFITVCVLAIMLTVLIFLAAAGPAVEVKNFKVPDAALNPKSYYYFVPKLPSPSLPMILSCISARFE